MSTNETKSALVPVTEGDARRDALMRALGFDKLTEGQRELALAISSQYDLDPMLRHVVMIDGKPYITRDGLLHVAHKSGVFDGIEVDPPTLDDDKRFYRTVARVYRKDFSRPFVYPGRYPATGGNARYNEEMCIKVAEVMTLRRAFDVSAPVIEEQWDGDIGDAIETSQPTSLADRVAQRALAASASATQPETDASAPVESSDATPTKPVLVTEPEPEVEEGVVTPIAEFTPTAEELADADEGVSEEEMLDALAENDNLADVVEEETGHPIVSPKREPEPEVIEEARFVAPAGGFGAAPTPPTPKAESLEPEQAPTDDSSPLDLFKSWAASHDKELIKATAKSLFPAVTAFGQLSAQELGIIQHEVQKAEAKQVEDATTERCGNQSPLSGNLCTLDPAHKGVHRHGTRDSWS